MRNCLGWCGDEGDERGGGRVIFIEKSILTYSPRLSMQVELDRCNGSSWPYVPTRAHTPGSIVESA